MGKKGDLGPVCKIHAHGRWQKLTLRPKIISYKKSSDKFEQKILTRQKVRGGPFVGIFKGRRRHHRSITSLVMTKFFVKMSIHILYTLAKFDFEIQTLSKIIGKKLIVFIVFDYF